MLPLLICMKHACVHKLQCSNSYIGVLQNVGAVLVLVIFICFLLIFQLWIESKDWEALYREWSYLEGREQEAGKVCTDGRGGSELFRVF